VGVVSEDVVANGHKKRQMIFKKGGHKEAFA